MRDNELILLNDNHQHQGNKYEISMLSLGAKDFRFFAYQHLIVALAFFGYREKEAHIVGAIIVQQAFGIGILLLGVWERERNLKSAHEEISLALGIAIGDLDNAEHQHKLIQFVAARYSSELLRNRLSDLCRWIQMGWTWLGVIVQYGILLGVVWYTVKSDLSNSVYAWWVVAVFFFWIPSVLFAFACKLVTGRFPGEAREVRKSLAETYTQRAA